jgi:hypothetical protein
MFEVVNLFNKVNLGALRSWASTVRANLEEIFQKRQDVSPILSSVSKCPNRYSNINNISNIHKYILINREDSSIHMFLACRVYPLMFFFGNIADYPWRRYLLEHQEKLYNATLASNQGKARNRHYFKNLPQNFHENELNNLLNNPPPGCSETGSCSCSKTIPQEFFNPIASPSVNESKFPLNMRMFASGVLLSGSLLNAAELMG